MLSIKITYCNKVGVGVGMVDILYAKILMIQLQELEASHLDLVLSS